MPNPICIQCDRVFEKTKSGIKIKIDENRAQQADKYICRGCGAIILSDFGTIYMDPEPKKYDVKHPRFNR